MSRKDRDAVRNLMRRVAADEAALRERQLVAPCVRGGRIEAKVEGLTYTFVPQPASYEGWGVFQPVSVRAAELEHDASPEQIAEWLEPHLQMRLILVVPVRGKSWLAHPANVSDMEQRIGAAEPVAVHLVGEPGSFDTVLGRYDGHSWWYEAADDSADPALSAALRSALASGEAASAPGLTPEHHAALALARAEIDALQQRHPQTPQLESQLASVIQAGGGELLQWRDLGAEVRVQWVDPEGRPRETRLRKADLAVLSGARVHKRR